MARAFSGILTPCITRKGELSMLAIARLLRSLGLVPNLLTSGGEIDGGCCEHFICGTDRFHRVRKTKAELAQGSTSGVLSINASNRKEVERIDRLATLSVISTRIALDSIPTSTHRHPFLSLDSSPTSSGCQSMRRGR